MKQLFFLLLISPLFSKAQIIEKEAADTILQEVFVTATRQKTVLLNLPYSVNKVTQVQLNEFGFRTTPEALIGSTGVFVQKTNHGGGSPFVRALTGNQNLLLVDGIRLNNSTYRYGPNQYLNTIDLYNISSIEVVRGTGSVQYGSDAMGGVIQLFTKTPKFSKSAEWHGLIAGKMVSDDMEYSGRAEMAFQSNNLSIQAGYTSRVYGDLIGGDTTGKQAPSGYKEQAFNIKLLWKLGVRSLLTLSSQQLIQKDVPLYHRVVLENYQYYQFAPQQRSMHYAKYELIGKSGLFEKLILSASLQKTKETRDYYKIAAVNRFLEEDRVSTVGLTTEIHSTINQQWTANSGVEFYQDQVLSSKEQTSISNNNATYQRGLYPNNASSRNFSLYSLHQIKWKAFQIDFGLRYNAFTLKMKDTAAGLNQLGEIVVTPSSLVGNLSILYHINLNQSLYGSFSSGYRAPNIDDMGSFGLVDFRYEVPAYGLKPEKSFNTEIGYRIHNNRVTVSTALFYMHLTDLVTRVQVPGQQIGGYNVYIKENNQESFIRGVEFEINYRFSKSLSLESGLAYAFGQNTTRNEPLRRVPPCNGRILLKYKVKGWNLAFENLFADHQDRLAQGDKDDNRIPSGGTPGWYVMNLYGGYQLKDIAIRTGLMNIFNADYRMHGSGINAAGRNLFLSVQFQF